MGAWGKSEPGGELAAGAEQAGVGRIRGRGAGRDQTYAGDGCEPAARLILPMPAKDTALQALDLRAERLQLTGQAAKGGLRQFRKAVTLQDDGAHAT